MRRVALVGLLLAGCTQADVVATFDTPDAAGPADGGGPDAGAEDFCHGGGPVIEVGDGLCGGDLARRAFRFAICTCEALVASAPVHTDAFDSREGAYAPGVGGALGVNGRLDLGAPTRIDGALVVGDATGLNAGGSARIDVAQSLTCGGPVISQAPIAVQGDLRAAGRLAAADLYVGGDLVLPVGADVEVSGTLEAPTPTRAAVSVPPPCACDASSLLDLAALVAARADDHDDARAGLTPDALRAAQGRVTLPCGRYYFDRIHAPADLTISATGRTAIFVAGDLSASGALRVEVADGAELDLVVAGQLVTSEPPIIGSERHPASARVYVGGAGTVQLGGGGQFYGNLYAPRAEVVTSGPLEVFGSLFARRIAASGGLVAHFDRAVERAADECPPPEDPSCASCIECRNSSCIDGACGPCRGDEDCCAPLRCEAGACVSDWTP